MYNLSKDYTALFALLLEGKKAVGFVDHKWHGFDEVFEDVCQIKRMEPYRIGIFARGTQYAGVYPFDEGKLSELELFINACTICNLRFIMPA